METINRYDNYPARVVILSNLVSLGIYGLGFMIIYRLGLAFSFFYLIYILIFELRLIRNHCTNCYYWGKICGFGKGRVRKNQAARQICYLTKRNKIYYENFSMWINM